MQKRLIVTLLSLFFTGQVYSAYISDRLQAGFYAKPDSESKPQQALPSGTPLEVLEEKDEFSRVRLADNSEGWVASDFITDEKPVREQLLELQAKNGSLKKERQHSEQMLAAARKEIKQLRDGSNQKTPSLQNSGDSDQTPNLERSTATDAGRVHREQTNGHQFTLWHLSLLIISVCTAFISGILFRNNRLAKRFGGFRF